ncbi:hypothetical protein EV127DRAFT_489881 [Xylaria flabelliformis]|nr:hypothetical protein EV127DRAFT_489881 [Xylaria flabelliformis]
MCRYRRSIYLCNHTQLSAEPFVLCSTQQDYISGKISEPCDMAQIHTCTTIRVRQLCQQCDDKKAATDSRISEVKSKMAELRQHLNEKYADCMKHIDEEEASLKSASEGEEKETMSPVEAFLKAKKNEKHAHLMMLGP